MRPQKACALYASCFSAVWTCRMGFVPGLKGIGLFAPGSNAEIKLPNQGSTTGFLQVLSFCGLCCTREGFQPQ